MKSFVLPFYLFVIILVGLLNCELTAQWVRMNGPYGWEFNNIISGNSTVLAGGPSHGAYRSTDNGMHWVEANSGLWATDVTALGFFNGNFLAGSWDGTNVLLFLSSDNANTWTQINTIKPKNLITCFVGKDSLLFAGTYGDGVYRSSDGGINWVKPNNAGLQHPVVSLLVFNSNLYAGTWGGAIYESSDNGDSWSHLSIPNYNTYTTGLFVLNNNLYMASGGNLFSTTNNGASWNTVTSSVPFVNTGFVVQAGSNLYAGTYDGIYLSTDGGISWSNIGLSNASVEAFTLFNGNLIAGTRDVGIFTSQDNGATWLQTGALNNMMVQTIAVIDSNLIVGDNGQEGLFISRDNGNSYKEYYNLNHSYTLCLKIKDSLIYAGTEGGGNGSGGIFKSSDLGKNWNCIGLNNIPIFSINYNPSYLFVGTDRGVFRTSNEGASWNQVNNGIPYTRVNSLAVIDTVLFAGTNVGTFKTVNNGNNWTSNGLSDTAVTSILNIGNSLFAGTAFGIFKNVPPDTTWIRIGFVDTVVYFLESKNNILFAQINSGLFSSTNNGISWFSINDGFDKIPISSFAVGDTFMYAGSWGEGVWRRKLSEIISDAKYTENTFPSKFEISQNYPNPFNPSTKISFALPHRENVKLKIYNLLGEEIVMLFNDILEAGNYQVEWNGENKDHQRVATGIYFYRIEAGKYSDVKKMLLIH